MTRIALQVCGDMTGCRLRGRATTRTMAGFANTCGTGIMNPCATSESGGSMAGTAIQARRGMILGHAGRCYAMTGIAACRVGYAAMIEGCRNETTVVGGNTVTDATILVCLNMAVRFTRG